MNKAAFFAQLERELASLSPADRERSLGYFEEMIDDRIEEGLSEEEAVADLGDPKTIAAEILSESAEDNISTQATSAEKSFHGCPLWLAILLAVLALPVWLPVICTLAVTVVCLYMIPWIVLIAIFCTAVGCVLGGIASSVVAFLCIPVSGIFNGMMLLGISLFCCGFGLLLLFPAVYGSIWFAKGTALCFKKLSSLRKEKKS